MYQRVEDGLHMTANEVSERYPDRFVLMRRDNREISNISGIVLYEGDDYNELFSLMVSFSEPLCIVIEGENYRRSLGGVVVGG